VTMRHHRVFFALLFALCICSCSKDDPKPIESNLVEATFLDSRTADEIQFLIALSGRDVDPTIFKYDVKVFKVKYETTYRDQTVVASGLIAIPITTDRVGTLSVHHGTIVRYEEAPSALDKDNLNLLLYGAVASSGFVTVIPDLIGFGESKNIFHPYYVEEATATAIIDNIEASVKLAKDNGIKSTGKLFLAGYSQGGYSTLAAHKSIEKDPLESFDLIASFPAAGGYDLVAMEDYTLNQSTYPQPFYLAYIAKSYENYYTEPTLTSDFFNEPFASRIDGLFNGLNGQTDINNQLTQSIPDLIRSNVLSGFDSDPSLLYIRNLFVENSLTDWTPTIPIYFYHGNLDTTVPIENSVITYNKLIANGASSETIKLITLTGHDHSSGLDPYIEDLIDKLLQLK
jgi:pimeloyl-ACP methyl ester carboxylesterase